MTADSLLIVDDQRDYGDFIAKVATSAGFAATVTERVDDFRRELAGRQPSVLAIDLMMPDVDGIALLQELGKARCKASILLTSGLDVRALSWAETVGRELGLHIVGLIPKPVRVAELRALLTGLKTRTLA